MAVIFLSLVIDDQRPISESTKEIIDWKNARLGCLCFEDVA
jgi:hypothetical protein